MNYKRIYDSIIERSQTRLVPEGYVEHHHIVPRCMGGEDTKENIVVLTPEEHFLCHVLLVKIYPEESGLIYAVNKMCRGHKGKRKRRKLYGWLKRKYSEQRKVDSIGKGNTQYGTMWINKIGTTENKKIKKGEPIPDGWEKGRNLTNYKKGTCIICSKPTKTNKTRYCNNPSCQEEKKKSIAASGRKSIGFARNIRNKQKRKWINDGREEKLIPSFMEISNGFSLGRIVK